MKTSSLIIIWLITLSVHTHAQNYINPVIITPFSGGLSLNESVDTANVQSNSSQQKIINTYKPINSDYDGTAYYQRSKAQKISGLVLITGGSVISFIGLKSLLEFPNGYSSINKSSQFNRNENIIHSRLALTGLAMVAGSIPYFLSSLKNKNKGALRFASQKTSFGAPNKARKKVTGITYSIPLGKR